MSSFVSSLKRFFVSAIQKNLLKIIARCGDGTLITARLSRKAYGLAESDHEGINLYPEIARNSFTQLHLRALWINRNYQPDAVGDPMYVGIDTNRRDVEGVGKNAIGGLAPDHGQGKELIDGIWHNVVHLFMNPTRYLLDGLGLLSWKSSRSDQFLESFHRSMGDLTRAIILLEEPLGRLSGVLVAGSLREHGRYQHVEWVRRPAGFLTFDRSGKNTYLDRASDLR